MKSASTVFDNYCEVVESKYKDFLEDFLMQEIEKRTSKGFSSIRVFITVENDNIMQKCRHYILSKGYTVIMENETIYYTDKNTNVKNEGIPYQSEEFNEYAKKYQKVGGYNYTISWYTKERSN